MLFGRQEGPFVTVSFCVLFRTSITRNRLLTQFLSFRSTVTYNNSTTRVSKVSFLSVKTKSKCYVFVQHLQN